MILLPLLDVVFVGLVGSDPGHVEKQLAAILEDHKAVTHKVASADAAALARHAESSADIVKKLQVDGVIAGELVTDKGHRSLRIVIYDAAGDLRSLSEAPLTGKSLAAS
jgi:hypothetical protein